MKPFFSHNMKLQLQALGPQAFTDDPKVVAIFSPDEKISFYITEYHSKEDEFFGYMKSKGEIDAWGSVPRETIELLHQISQEESEQPLPPHELKKPIPISEFFLEIKKEILYAQLEKKLLERKKKQDKDQDQEPEP